MNLKKTTLVRRWSLFFIALSLSFPFTSVHPSIIYAETSETTIDEPFSTNMNSLPDTEGVPTQLNFSQVEFQANSNELSYVTIESNTPLKKLFLTLPEQATLVEESLATGITLATEDAGNYSLLITETDKLTIDIPLSFTQAGNYPISAHTEEDNRIETLISVEEFTPELEKIDETLLYQPEKKSDLSAPENDGPNNQKNPKLLAAVPTGRLVTSVTTWDAFLAALNNSAVTEITLGASLKNPTTGTSLFTLTRPITINGNGYTLDLGDGVLIFGAGSNYSRISNVRITTTNQAFAICYSNYTLYLNDIESFTVESKTVPFRFMSGKLVIDGGINSFFSSGRSRVICNAQDLVITNGAIVHVRNTGLIEPGSGADLTQPIKTTIDGGAKVDIISTEAPTSDTLRTNELLVSGPSTQLSIETTNVAPVANVAAVIDGSLKIKVDNQATFNVSNSSLSVPTIKGLSQLTLAGQSKFDIANNNIEGVSIQANPTKLDVDLDVSNLALWFKGRPNGAGTVPNQNFSNLEATLTGLNAKDIINTNHLAFKALYSADGLLNTSRLSDTGQALTPPVDPLNPGVEINPESKPTLPENQGDFRIDFVSAFDFGTQFISAKDQTYYAKKQLLLNEAGTVIPNEERPNFIQVTDTRGAANGWQLSVTQTQQFTSTSGKELHGASISLKNQSLHASHTGASPNIASSTVSLLPGNKQVLLSAQGQEGKGTWVYRFGDNETAHESVALHVPASAGPEAASYSTSLNWELSSVPENTID